MKIRSFVKRSLLITVLMLTLNLGVAPEAQAVNITVNIVKPGVNDDGYCSLIEALSNANDDAKTYPDCPAGNGADIIDLQALGPYPLTAVHNTADYANGLPSITSEILINGHGATIKRNDNAPAFRIFHVAVMGTLILKDLRITNGSEVIGGGILNRGNLRLMDSIISGNTSGGLGAGIYSAEGTVALVRSTVSNNVGGGGIFSSANSIVELINSTISDNYARNGGGGITNEGMAKLVNSTIEGNTADYGGGIDNYDGTMELIACSIFSNNALTTGGGIRTKGGNLTLTNTTLSLNNANTDGGGISSEPSSIRLTNSIISDNRAGNKGGGIHNDGEMILTNSTISDNQANDGGGIFNGYSSAAEVTKTTISGNRVANTGGGIFNQDGTVTLTNSTISGNFVNPGITGGGIYNFEGQVILTNSTVSYNGGTVDVLKGGGIYNGGPGMVKLINTIVAHNRADCFGDQIISNGHNLDSDGTCVTNGVNSDITNPNPDLGPLQINLPGNTKTVSLLFGSPAINAGDNSVCPATDQRGVSRPQGARCDIGAFELSEAELGSLTIIKEAPAADPQHQFVFVGDLGTFDLAPGESQTITRVPPGTYWVFEDKQSFPEEGHWGLLGAKCQVAGGDWFDPDRLVSSDRSLTGIQISLLASQHLTCILLNQPETYETSIAIYKEAPAASPEHQFVFFGELGKFDLKPGEFQTFGNLPPGTYRVIEDGRSFPENGRWDLISVNCQGDDFETGPLEIFKGDDDYYFAGVDISIGDNMNLFCTFLNEPANIEEETETQIYLPLIFKQ